MVLLIILLRGWCRSSGRRMHTEHFLWKWYRQLHWTFCCRRRPWSMLLGIPITRFLRCTGIICCSLYTVDRRRGIQSLCNSVVKSGSTRGPSKQPRKEQEWFFQVWFSNGPYFWSKVDQQPPMRRRLRHNLSSLKRDEVGSLVFRSWTDWALLMQMGRWA